MICTYIMRTIFLLISFIIIIGASISVLWPDLQNREVAREEIKSLSNITGSIRVMKPSEITDGAKPYLDSSRVSPPQENIELPTGSGIKKDSSVSAQPLAVIDNNPVKRTQTNNIANENIGPATNSDAESNAVPQIINRLMPLTHSAPRSVTHDVTHIVIHFASNVIARPDNPHIPEDVINIFQKYGVSAHYLIARDGVIFRLVDESRVAFHAGRGTLADFPQYTNNLNRHSIGIELLAMGTEEEMSRYVSRTVYRSIPAIHIGYTDAQYRALNYLLPQIYARQGIQPTRRYVIGHDEYARNRKIDPGSLFDWSRIGF